MARGALVPNALQQNGYGKIITKKNETGKGSFSEARRDGDDVLVMLRSFTRLLFTAYYTQPCMDTEPTCMVLIFLFSFQRHNNKAQSTQWLQSSQDDPEINACLRRRRAQTQNNCGR